MQNQRDTCAVVYSTFLLRQTARERTQSGNDKEKVSAGVYLLKNQYRNKKSKARGKNRGVCVETG